MKSKEIRVRNLPKDDVPFYVSNVKPTSFLMIAMIAGISFLWIRSYLQVIGVMVIMVSLFSLLMLPDCKLYEIHHDYIVLYNRHDKSECFIIYYEDMVSWHYEWNPSYDQLVIFTSGWKCRKTRSLCEVSYREMVKFFSTRQTSEKES